MKLLLADISPTQWVLLALILVLIVLYPVFVYIRNKKDKEKFQQLNEGLKVGDKVLTGSGIYGTIVSMETKEQSKIVTLETGDENHKGYISVDALAIYSVVNELPAVEENSEVQPEEEKVEEEKVAEVVETKEEE